MKFKLSFILLLFICKNLIGQSPINFDASATSGCANTNFIISAELDLSAGIPPEFPYTKESGSEIFVSPTGSDVFGNGSPGSPFQSIQSGIAAAANGQIVTVLPGTYSGYGNIRISPMGKEIIIQSKTGPLNTTIDCEFNGRGFWVNQGESINTIIKGFNIINGKNVLPPTSNSDASAIFVDDNCGILIKDCFFQNNQEGCILFGDTQIIGPESGVENCYFSNNLGNCINSVKKSFYIEKCLFLGNIYAGGNTIQANPPQQWRNCMFVCNSAQNSILSLGHGKKVENSIFIGNTSLDQGIVYCGASSTGINTIDHCTFYNNNANYFNTSSNHEGQAKSSIYFPGAARNHVSANQSQLVFSNSLGDGISGNGNIQGDPLFADPNTLDFSLAAGSPCIGTGEANSDMGANMSVIPDWMSNFVNGYDANFDISWENGFTGDTLSIILSESQFIDVSFSNCSQSFTDSIFIEISEPTPSVDVISACGSYTWIDGITYTESNNEASFTVPNPGGCDSTATIELSLTINPNLASTTNLTICDADLPYVWNGLIFTGTDSQIANLSSVITGCDSLATLNLTVNPNLTSTTNLTICDTELPYSWNGLSITEEGSVSVTLNSVVTGCDSTITLNIQVNPTLNVIENIVVCSNAFPFEWNGITISNGFGTPSVNFVSEVTGCDSIVTLNISVNPILFAWDTITICENELPFDWNGLSLTEAGTESVLLSSALTGCDSTITLTLLVNTIPTSTTDTIVCGAQLPFLWNGLTFTAAVSQTETQISAETGCDSLATLTLDVVPTLVSLTELTICNTQLPYIWNGLTFTGTASQNATLTSEVTGCDSLATLNLTVNTILTSSTDLTICDTELPYTWNGLIFSGTDSQTALLTSVVSGCDSLATLNLTVNAINLGTTDITICESQLPFIWNGLIFNAGGAQTATLTNTITGCDYFATLNLTVIPAIESSVEITICASSFPYTWNGLVFSAGGSQTASLTSLATGCDSLATLNLTVTPEVFSTTEITICENQLPYTWNGLTFSDEGAQTAILTSLVTGCDSLATLELSTQNTLYSSTDTTVCTNALPFDWNGLTFTGSSVQTTSLTSYSGCDSVVTLFVYTIESSNAAFSASSNVISPSNPLVYFYNESYGANDFIWNYGDGNTSLDFEGLHEYALPLEDNYLVNLIAISSDGCTDTMSMEIVYELPGEGFYYVPNSFTPNSDEYNQVFRPVFADGFEPLNFTMYIYSRWGDEVFMSKDIHSGWDGIPKTNGNKAMNGTYTWKIFFTNPITNENIISIGHVNLIK